MPDFHPAPFDDFSAELHDPWPVVERLRIALCEAQRYCLGAENITGHCIEELLDRLPDEDGERRQSSPLPRFVHTGSSTIDEPSALATSTMTSDFLRAIEERHKTYGRRQHRYIEAARRLWHDDGQIEIDDHSVVSDGCGDGAYVMAWVWVSDDDLDPEPGPTYAVWIAEPDAWQWIHDQDFTCDDDPDSTGARRSAHAYARSLRTTYHCAYVAVRPAGKRPLPIRVNNNA